jgi:hypothetical protein
MLQIWNALAIPTTINYVAVMDPRYVILYSPDNVTVGPGERWPDIVVCLTGFQVRGWLSFCLPGGECCVAVFSDFFRGKMSAMHCAKSRAKLAGCYFRSSRSLRPACGSRTVRVGSCLMGSSALSDRHSRVVLGCQGAAEPYWNRSTSYRGTSSEQTVRAMLFGVCCVGFRAVKNGHLHLMVMWGCPCVSAGTQYNRSLPPACVRWAPQQALSRQYFYHVAGDWAEQRRPRCTSDIAACRSALVSVTVYAWCRFAFAVASPIACQCCGVPTGPLASAYPPACRRRPGLLGVAGDGRCRWMPTTKMTTATPPPTQRVHRAKRTRTTALCACPTRTSCHMQWIRC